MTASDHIKTPSMTISLQNKQTPKLEVELLARKFQKTNILEIISCLQVEEKIVINRNQCPLPSSERKRIYKIIITFEN